MKTALAAMYVAAGLSTAQVLSEVHHQVCQERPFGEYVLVATLWPVVGAVAAIEMAKGNHARNLCQA